MATLRESNAEMVSMSWRRHVLHSLWWRHNDHDSVSNHQPHECLLSRLFRRRSKKTSKLRVTGLCVGEFTGTGEFPAQRASYAENVSIWWRHHVQPCAIISLSMLWLWRAIHLTIVFTVSLRSQKQIITKARLFNLGAARKSNITQWGICYCIAIWWMRFITAEGIGRECR